MRTLIMLIVSAAILAGAYVFAFGMPAVVTESMGPASENGGATTAEVGNPGAGGEPVAGVGGRGARTATTVVTAPLETQPYVSVLSAVGSAQAIRSATVVSTASGEVSEADLSANRQVEIGDVLIRIDARTQDLNLEIAQAELAQAVETVARYERLQATGNSTVTDVTLSDARLAQRLAEAEVGLAQVALDDRTIRAPISGRLSLSTIDVGDTVTTEAAIVTIDDAAALLVEFELPERAIGLLAEVKSVLASTPTFTGRVFDGEIISFDSRIDDVTRSVTVKARIENADALLWPGMTFVVRLEHETDPLAAVPSTAITWSRTGSAIWVDEGGAAAQVPVTILYRRDETVWISGEIAEDASVVTEGAQKLRPGARLVTPGFDGDDRPVGGEAPGELRAGDGARPSPLVGAAPPQDLARTQTADGVLPTGLATQ